MSNLSSSSSSSFLGRYLIGLWKLNLHDNNEIPRYFNGTMRVMEDRNEVKEPGSIFIRLQSDYIGSIFDDLLLHILEASDDNDVLTDGQSDESSSVYVLSNRYQHIYGHYNDSKQILSFSVGIDDSEAITVLMTVESDNITSIEFIHYKSKNVIQKVVGSMIRLVS